MKPALETVRAELESAGLGPCAEEMFLSHPYFLVFRKH